MKDPFLQFIRMKPHRVNNAVSSPAPRHAGGEHSIRAHSKFSASGAERWFNCPGSVKLSEGIPDKSNFYAEEGTLAHEVLESLVRHKPTIPVVSREMINHCTLVANFIMEFWFFLEQPELLIEEKVSLKFIHPEAFGTLDYAIVDYFETLHIMDFKYGKTYVSPDRNLQFIFYALAVGFLHHWNFKTVRMWTLQPRIKGFDGFPFWEIPIQELKDYIPMFENAIQAVEENPNHYVEGSWCGWCKAKSICPLKTEKKFDKAKLIFQGL